jgi:hypothetical protein|nr:MAG TPA_asm: Fip1 motif [Caudoviricetes sp.]
MFIYYNKKYIMEKIYEMIEDALRQCDFDVEKIKALATYLELEEEEISDFCENLEVYDDKYYYNSMTFIVMTRDEVFEEIRIYREDAEEEVKWRVPADLRDYFDYQSYAEDAYSDIYDIWDIKASDTINIDGTIYEVIQINE